MKRIEPIRPSLRALRLAAAALVLASACSESAIDDKGVTDAVASDRDAPVPTDAAEVPDGQVADVTTDGEDAGDDDGFEDQHAEVLDVPETAEDTAGDASPDDMDDAALAEDVPDGSDVDDSDAGVDPADLDGEFDAFIADTDAAEAGDLGCPDGAACDDGDPCTVDDACSGGSCLPGAQNVCECQTAADCTAFEDGNPCNGTLTCATGTFPYKCVVDPATIVVCVPSGDSACLESHCSVVDGLCKEAPGEDELGCDDGNACTVADSCDAGVCNPGALVSCDDGNPCTADICEPIQGCVHDTNGEEGQACDPMQKCVVPDSGVCVAGECTGGTAKDCIGLADMCNYGTCNSATGACTAIAKQDGMACVDTDYCTIGDKCKAGKCMPGQPKKCEANATCDGGACKCDPGYEKKEGICAVLPCPAETTAVDVDGKTVCAPEYPAWGIRPESPPAEWFVDNGDGTVRDVQSGLLWQKGYAPEQIAWWEAYVYCEALELGGRTDWRLPSRAELLTLVDYAKDAPATPDVFEPALSFAWTATPLHGFDNWMLWTISMNGGVVAYDVLGDPNGARCVQSPGVSGFANRYLVDSEAGTVMDELSGLTWEQDANASGKKSWAAAVDYCVGLQLAGANWRLPTIPELISITDVGRSAPATAVSAFPATPNDAFWSSTPSIGSAGQWAVDFERGDVGYGGSGERRTRCVR